MKRLLSLAAALACGVSLSAMAASPERAEYKADKAQAKADYTIAKAHCKKLDGDAHRDCMRDAKARYDAKVKMAKAKEERADETREHHVK